MRITILAGLVVAVAALAPSAHGQSVVGSMHDLSSGGAGSYTATNVDRVCVFCHTPHQATTANAQDPLWNHTVSSQGSYGVYASSTLNAGPTAFGGGTTPGTLNTSQLCMSCHDGTVAVGSLYNDPNQATPDNNATTIPNTNSAYIGVDLSDDHPVNFTFDGALASADGGLVTPAGTNCVDTTGAADPCDIPLYDEGVLTDTVQCASCHDPHDSTAANNPFLRVVNTSSNLCTQCHIK